MDLIVAGTRDAITMIEGFAREMSEDNMLQAILFAHEQIVKIIDLVEELRRKAGLEAKVLPAPPPPSPAYTYLRDKYGSEIREIKLTSGKARPGRKDQGIPRTSAQGVSARRAARPSSRAKQVAAALAALEETCGSRSDPGRQTH